MDYQKLSGILPKFTNSWDCSDVYIWLSFIGLPNLFSKFRKAKIDGSCLGLLTQADLRFQLEVTNKLLIRKLMTWIKHGLKDYDKHLNNQLQKSKYVSHAQYNLQAMKQSHKKISQWKLQNSQNHEIRQNFRRKSLEKARKKTSQVQQQQKKEVVHSTQQFSQTKDQDRLTDMIPSSKYCRKSPSKQLIIQLTQSQQICSYSFFQSGGIIGRECDCSILVVDDRISHHHCKINYHDKNYYLVDHSLIELNGYGTWKKIVNKTILEDKVMLQMGDNCFKFRFIENMLYIDVLETEDGIFPNMNKVRTTFSFNTFQTNRLIIGRKSTSQISFPSDTTLSNIHAKVYFINSKWYIQDMSTTNGTWMLLTKGEYITNNMVFKISPNKAYICKLHSQGQQIQTKKKVTIYCKTCNKHERNIVYYPCFQCINCEKCSSDMKTCPHCLQPINNKMKIYPV